MEYRITFSYCFPGENPGISHIVFDADSREDAIHQYYYAREISRYENCISPILVSTKIESIEEIEFRNEE